MGRFEVEKELHMEHDLGFKRRANFTFKANSKFRERCDLAWTDKVTGRVVTADVQVLYRIQRLKPIG